MPTDTGGSTAPNPNPLVQFIEHLKTFDLQLYTDPDREEPSMEVPHDTIRKFYPIASRRVSRWLFAQWLAKFGVPAKTGDIQAAVAHLENAAYEKGVSLPNEEKAARFNDDPVIAAIHSWVPTRKGGWVQELATKAFEYLRFYGENHPNKKDLPKDTAAVGRRIKALDAMGMLAAIKIEFKSVHTESGTVYKFTRTEDADRLTAVRIEPSGGNKYAVKDLRTDSIDLFQELESAPEKDPDAPPPPPGTHTASFGAKPGKPKAKKDEAVPQPGAPAESGGPAKKPKADVPDVHAEHTDQVPIEERKEEEVKKPKS